MMGGKGSGGHNKKSVEDHIRLGTYRRDRHGELPKELLKLKRRVAREHGEGLPVNRVTANKESLSGLPACPYWLDDTARVEWWRVCLRLRDMGTLDIADVGVIECYCAAYSRWQTAEKRVMVLEKTYDGRTINAITRAAKDALNQVRAYQNDLGLTPKSVVVAPKKENEQTPLDNFLDQQARKL